MATSKQTIQDIFSVLTANFSLLTKSDKTGKIATWYSSYLTPIYTPNGTEKVTIPTFKDWSATYTGKKDKASLLLLPNTYSYIMLSRLRPIYANAIGNIDTITISFATTALVELDKVIGYINDRRNPK
jgi:hypothetical protein